MGIFLIPVGSFYILVRKILVSEKLSHTSETCYEIRNAATQGRRYLSPTANAEYLIMMQSPEANARLDDEARQVLHLLATGAHIGQISLRLNIDNRRVYWIREKLRRYFGANTNEHLISCAYAEGILRNAL